MPTFANIAAYKFATLDGLKPLRERLLAQCRSWDLKGTILLSTEGINLFVAGPHAEIGLLVDELRSLPGLRDLTPKVSESADQPFTLPPTGRNWCLLLDSANPEWEERMLEEGETAVTVGARSLVLLWARLDGAGDA